MPRSRSRSPNGRPRSPPRESRPPRDPCRDVVDSNYIAAHNLDLVELIAERPSVQPATGLVVSRGTFNRFQTQQVAQTVASNDVLAGFGARMLEVERVQGREQALNQERW
eukprot:570787_1